MSMVSLHRPGWHSLVVTMATCGGVLAQQAVDLRSGGTLPDTLLLAAHGPSEQAFVVVGGNRERDPAVLWRTIDGGRTFAVAAMPVVGARLYDVWFADARVGYACGFAGVVLKTSDGGESWRPVDVPVPEAWFATVHFHDASVGIVAGGGEAGAVLLRTVDGGKQWQEVPLPGAEDSRNVRDVRLLDRDHGVACGENGHLWRTVDAGRSWRRIEIETDSWLRHLSFPDARHGFVVAADGTVFASDDGGARWQRRGKVVGDKANSICFLDASRGYLATMGGSVHATTDGGATFERIARSSGAVTDVGMLGRRLLVVGQGVCRFLE